MNALWEEYIFRILQKHKTDKMQVFSQESKRFWKNKCIRPDIIFKTGKETFIIDTKWKIIETNNPSDEDLKQMFVYNLHWNAEKALLLYPKTGQTDSSFEEFHYDNLDEKNEKKKCKTGFVDITEGGGIKSSEKIAEEIFSKLK